MIFMNSQIARSEQVVNTMKTILLNFNSSFLNESTCREAILRIIHSNKFTCPYCNIKLEENKFQSFLDLKRIKCSGCGKSFNALKGTVLCNAHLSFSQLMLITVLIAANIPISKIETITKVHRESVILLKKKLNQKP